MIKKQWLTALVLFLLIPLVWMLEGLLFNRINPEIAAGHPNYERNFHLLSLLKNISMLASGVVVVALWLLVCLLVIRAKQRSYWWLLLAAFGPFGFAALAMLNDRAPADADRYARFMRGLNGMVRAIYELCLFGMVWVLAYAGMVALRMLIVGYEAAATGVSAAQIMVTQNASSGMWAFSEGCEVMYLVVLLYLVWPVAFNLVGRQAAPTHLPSSG